MYSLPSKPRSAIPSNEVSTVTDDQFDGFAVLEEAALMMVGASNEEALLQTYRAELERSLLDQRVAPRAAASLAARFVEIIARRHKEIVTLSSVNLGTLQ
jgi:hypothetical protein